MSAEEIASAFVGQFYQVFDSNADGLAGLYQPTSMLTFEGQQFLGSAAIVEKLKQLGSVRHNPQTIDVQPSVVPNSIVVVVTGHVQVENGNPLMYCEFFHLVATAQNSFYVHNDIFRLNYS